jgi:acyl-homoserine lactone acylase PvdQ
MARPVCQADPSTLSPADPRTQGPLKVRGTGGRFPVRMLTTRLALAALLCAIAVPAAAGAATPAPYGTNDAGGFRNVLPPGEAGVANALQLAQFKLNGSLPKHWADQEPLYDGLLYASPTLTEADVAKYYKDATFGVKPEDIEATISPRTGVTIVRDKQYGIPHIYGDTFEDVEFGAGYAGAQDRLFLIDVLRHTGRATLSSFVGGSAGNRAQDQTQWAIAPYTEADLQKQVDQGLARYGAQGEKVRAGAEAFVAGINQYIDEALLDPTKMPAEYAALGKKPEHFTVTDVIAEASLIGGIFGKGGGAEVKSAQLVRALEKRFGRKKGRRSWADFRSKNDPEAPTTILKKRFPYETAPAFSKRGLALPDPGSVQFTPPVTAADASATKTAALGQNTIGTQISHALDGHASNWLLLPKRKSKSGHPLAVIGPQVGYYLPEILMEEELHGPGFDARGTAFPGVNLMVQLGHGRDYAWSATTATSDNVDTFAEVLCQDDFHYLYKGQCLPMEKLERTNSWTPNAVDSTAPGSETLTVYRTVHGIVYARGTVRGKNVAYALARTTYMHEAESSVGFYALNDPAQVKDYNSFRKAIGGINFAFNWSYVDSRDIGYQLSGCYPKRAKRTSPDLPVFGTGQYDWQGFNPQLQTAKYMSLNQRPHVKNPDYLVSWNNKQAPGWAAADDNFSYGPDHRQAMLVAFVRRALKGGRKVQLHQLVQAMEEPATQDMRVLRDFPIIARVAGQPKNPALRNALALLAKWRAAGGHRRDLNKDGKYDDDAAVTLMDAWWPKLAEAIFRPALGDNALRALRALNDYGEVRPAPAAPDFFAGFESYISKDLRDLTQRRKVRGPWSRVYCGGGKLKRCRAAILGSLAAALSVTPGELYGKGDCASDPDAECYDRNRWVEAAAVTIPPMPFQNRPTFQQAIDIPRRLPR